MLSNNISNVEKGRLFRDQVCQVLTKRYKIEFFKEQPLPIGNPPKEHKFDLVSVDSKYIVECKAISWTKTGNNPSAKITSCNDAVTDLSCITGDIKKLLVIRCCN